MDKLSTMAALNAMLAATVNRGRPDYTYFASGLVDLRPVSAGPQGERFAGRPGMIGMHRRAAHNSACRSRRYIDGDPTKGVRPGVAS